MEEAPIENPGSIGLVERYHAPLRKAYVKLRETLSRTNATDQECLQAAVYAANATIGPEGLCPMLLVFGALPRPAQRTPSPTQVERQNAIELAKVEIQKEQASRRIKFALTHTNSPKAKEQSAYLRNLPSGALVLVYRTTTKGWEGPFHFISIEGETVVVQLHQGRRIFRSTCVRPWQKSILGKHIDDLKKKDVPRQSDKTCDDQQVNTANDENIDIDLGDTAKKVKVKRGTMNNGGKGIRGISQSGI